MRCCTMWSVISATMSSTVLPCVGRVPGGVIGLCVVLCNQPESLNTTIHHPTPAPTRVSACLRVASVRIGPGQTALTRMP